jgi:hypothetical protein
MKYDYGEDVIFRSMNGDGTSIDRLGTVVGITEVQSTKQADVLGFAVGTTLYTVEFGDGSDRLVPENQLTLEMGRP